MCHCPPARLGGRSRGGIVLMEVASGSSHSGYPRMCHCPWATLGRWVLMRNMPMELKSSGEYRSGYRECVTVPRPDLAAGPGRNSAHGSRSSNLQVDLSGSTR
ncbi:hypothetical protein GDO81_027742 [Engystomops pustulosus]|uniref:Uncharacterized protein n=1 Tax=Engystomops pustulosus TaxID=76066 RepID=A0AAV6YYI6_ENGPU|nr:hypothetical protein GDO81_027742 [Engystomops pustulosus]